MPRLEGTHPLTAREIEELRTRGHVLLRGVLSPAEMASCRAFLRQYVLAKEEVLVGISSEAAAAEFNLGDAPPDVADFMTSPRLGEIAARLLGVEAVRVLHFCGLFKPAGGAWTPWHQDLTFIPIDTEKLVSAWIPLTDFTPEMGDLTFAEGSHQQGIRLNPADWERFSLAQNGPMAAGDISFHLGWTLHNASGNTSDRLREAIGIGYYADGARIQVKREAPFMKNLLDLYFPGLGDGELAVGPMNPVVFGSAV